MPHLFGSPAYHKRSFTGTASRSPERDMIGRGLTSQGATTDDETTIDLAGTGGHRHPDPGGRGVRRQTPGSAAARSAAAAAPADAGPRLRTVQTNGITLRIAETGKGPLVILLHGFPESWYSWRHQLPALRRPGSRRCARPARIRQERQPAGSTPTTSITSPATSSASSTRSARKPPS